MIQTISKSQIFFYCLVACIAGNIFFGVTKSIEAVFAVCVLGIILYVLFFRFSPFVFLLIIVCFFCSALFFWSTLEERTTHPLTQVYEEDISFEGRIVGDVEKNSEKQRLRVLVETVNGELLDQPKTRILVNTMLFPEYRYGDRVQVSGILKEGGIIEDFNYGDYLLKDNIIGAIYRAKVTKLSEEGGPLSSIYVIKGAFTRTINILLPEPEASFLAGLLIGERRSIPDEVLDAFNKTGTTHIIAISGYNITLISSIILSMLKGRVSRRMSTLIIIASLTVFVLITGASASVVRAAVMGSIVLISKMSGRLSDVKNVLALSAVLMLIQNPFVLTYDIGFQLSYVSTIGLVYFAKPCERLCFFVPKKGGLREALALTLASQIATLPIVILNFKRISLIAPLANLLIAPFIPLGMATGFFAVVIGFLSTDVGMVASWVSYLILHTIVAIIMYLSKLSYIVIDIQKSHVPLSVMIWSLGLTLWFGIKRLHYARAKISPKN
ncbi:ComEC family competence protein [Patescibacteria group bacterium]|nr:ComEC family competence protein [Patescibacteria group bacterium]